MVRLTSPLKDPPLFSKPKPEPILLELERSDRLPPLDSQTRESVTALEHHPGFKYILARLRFDKAILRSKLERERPRDLADIAYLQAGIAWVGYLENFLRREKLISERPRLDPSKAELDSFYESLASIEEVGSKV